MMHTCEDIRLFLFFFAVWLFNTTYGAVGIIPPQEKPPKFAYANGCYVKELQRVIGFNTSYATLDGTCLLLTCDYDEYVYITGCANSFEGECTLITGKKTLGYPACCDTCVISKTHNIQNNTSSSDNNIATPIPEQNAEIDNVTVNNTDEVPDEQTTEVNLNEDNNMISNASKDLPETNSTDNVNIGAESVESSQTVKIEENENNQLATNVVMDADGISGSENTETTTEVENKPNEEKEKNIPQNELGKK